MSKNLTSLVLATFDSLGQIKNFKQLLEIALEEADAVESDDGLESRTSLLLSSYLSLSDPHFQDLEINLKRIRSLICAACESSNGG